MGGQREREINGEMNKKCSTLHISVSLCMCVLSLQMSDL